MNYIGSTRSNYFAVKNPEAFKVFLQQFGDLELIEGTAEKKGLFGFLVGGDSGSLPNSKSAPDPEGEEGDVEDVDVDFIAELAPHLADGQVGVVIEIGYEGMRFLGGYATAFNNQSQLKQLNLDDIYEVAKELGAKVTRAEY